MSIKTVLLFQLEQKQVVPPFKPNISGEFGLDNFDAQFTNEPIQLTPDDEWVAIFFFFMSLELIVFSGFSELNFSFALCSDVVKKIDQSEFEGFEYINPLLMSAEECVWGTRHLCSHNTHPHTHTRTHTLMHVLHGVSVSLSCMVMRQPDDINLFGGGTYTVERLFAKTSLTLSHL